MSTDLIERPVQTAVAHPARADAHRPAAQRQPEEPGLSMEEFWAKIETPPR